MNNHIKQKSNRGDKYNKHGKEEHLYNQTYEEQVKDPNKLNKNPLNKISHKIVEMIPLVARKSSE